MGLGYSNPNSNPLPAVWVIWGCHVRGTGPGTLLSSAPAPCLWPEQGLLGAARPWSTVYQEPQSQGWGAGPRKTLAATRLSMPGWVPEYISPHPGYC